MLKLSPAMKQALMFEVSALPEFTVLLNWHPNVLNALRRRGLVEGMRLTDEGRRVGEKLRTGEDPPE